ncbi:L-threonylcarbamoyladenylate synthase [Prolixibacter denitrificans]|uniref:Threonylcarbamoyl-AMP synthase n=1 Tax=Prolixibacter denitrificans TaxID=1541063 RepID=A0A2P8CD13_9BACT|nr:L-threonylcarbamoyladenylate synthase [Prolixibacter denitrificans]PSK82864.1 tRNA threonylcarbamoyl adenosine modification protein (Sua5/YciO/YrdC/YwlC family) [Prolixibacter denitrificans]GET21320.1 threonylcarbamoyl-AMP synthase [Prolixibacter denitrificans]
MLIRIYDENPNQRDILKVVEVLRNGGVIVYPTDTIYGIGCDITQPKAVERVARLKNLKPEKADFSFICHDLSHISDFSKPISNPVFKMMKKNLPGPFTFIIQANSQVPKMFKNRKKSVGVRVPDNNIIREIVRELGNPVMSTSVRDEDEILEYTTDPELIEEKFGDLVDLVIDGGYGDNIPSTVVDCTGDVPEIVRQGKGELIE